MKVVIIGGAGTVGSTVAYTLAVERPAVEIDVVDVEAEAARGHAIDARHARTLGQLPGFAAEGTVGGVGGGAPTAEALADADLAVVAASAPRPSGTAERGGRLAFLEANREIADEVAALLTGRSPLPVIVVTNPVDRIAYRLWRATGWDRSRFLGYSLSETARAADRLAALRDVPASGIYCPTVGEHGEHVVPLFSRATVDGEPLSLSDSERAAVRDYVRDVPYDVISMRGAEETSRWVTGRGVARLAGAVLDGGVDGPPIAPSVPLDGEYGFADVCLSVPARLDSDGVREVLEWELDPDERDRLAAAYESVSASQ